MDLSLFGPQPDDLLDSIYELLAREDVPSLADFVERRCEEMDVSKRQLADALGVPHTRVQNFLNGKTQKVDPLLLIRLSHFLRIGAKDILSMLVASASPDEVAQMERAKRAGYIAENFDLERLRRIGFIDSVQDYNAIEERIKTYFDFEKLNEYSALDIAPAFSKNKMAGNDRMVRFWINVVHAQFRRFLNPNAYDRARLVALLPKLRTATADPNRGFTSFVHDLYGCGVTVVVESYVTTTQVKGATFVVDGRPCVVLTNFQKRYDTLWFTLAHELCHVVNDFDWIRSQGYHITGEQNLFMDPSLEATADRFARLLLLDEDSYQQAKRFIGIDAMIRECSQLWGIHPSIIYGRYLYDHPDNYSKFGKHLERSDSAIRNHHLEPWTLKTIDETIPLLRASLEPTSS